MYGYLDKALCTAVDIPTDMTRTDKSLLISKLINKERKGTASKSDLVKKNALIMDFMEE